MTNLIHDFIQSSLPEYTVLEHGDIYIVQESLFKDTIYVFGLSEDEAMFYFGIFPKILIPNNHESRYKFYKLNAHDKVGIAKAFDYVNKKKKEAVETQSYEICSKYRDLERCLTESLKTQKIGPTPLFTDG